MKEGVPCSPVTYLWVCMCVGGSRRLCIYVCLRVHMDCVREREKERMGRVDAFHELRGAGRRSCLSLLRMINEDVTKGFLLFSIIRDFHIDGAQNSQYVNYVAVFLKSCFLFERSWCIVHRHVIVSLSLFFSCFPRTLCVLHWTNNDYFLPRDLLSRFPVNLPLCMVQIAQFKKCN
jgi:hypothetical protein